MGPQLTLQASPALVAFSEMLALSAVELEDVVERELQDNPALDRTEADCPLCHHRLEGRHCRACATGVGTTGIGRRVGPTTDPIQALAEQGSAADLLLREVSVFLDVRDKPIAAYVIADLDSRGLLGREPAEVAQELSVDEGRVTRVIEAIREVGPPGICARDTTECLLLQLVPWDERGQAPRLLRRVIGEHLEDLGRGRTGRIARSLGGSQAEVLEARDFLRTHLRPFVTFAAPPDEPVSLVVADIVVRRRPDDPDEFDVDVTDGHCLGLGVDPGYVRLARVAAERQGLLSEGERRQIAHHVARARSFLARLGDRSTTLQAVAQRAVDRQRGLILTGRAGHLPLTRAEIAGDLGLHESTVSRAVSGKQVRLPSGRIVPFNDFFGSAQSVQECLQAIVASESPPLSDRELAAELLVRGHAVARRTVAKYRAQLGIAAQPLR